MFRGNHFRVLTHPGPGVTASLRNLAIGALRLAGRADITEATRWACRIMSRPIAILASLHDLDTAASQPHGL
uniref:Uncharacterized protein n=1 Tax=Nonomuraea gerenzanensis TaxID=93944 RepID=A0A1M4EQG0_9ACTN|nr:hypothetical protein BN4615_P10592 [Nonomuraea gerenzanensis]